MEFYLLKAFVEVAGTGHLTRAAERLHVSQPAVSGQIKALEDEFGVRLFERTSNGMVLTRHGRELLGPAQKVIAASEEMRRTARAIKGELAGRLRIGTLSDPEFIRIGELLGRTVERHPLIELELHHEISGAALEAVRGQSLDASFYYGDIGTADVAGFALTEVVYRVAGPAVERAPAKRRLERARRNAVDPDTRDQHASPAGERTVRPVRRRSQQGRRSRQRSRDRQSGGVGSRPVAGARGLGARRRARARRVRLGQGAAAHAAVFHLPV